MSDAERLLTKAELGELVGLTERSIERAVARGELAAVRFGGAVRFARADIERWIERNRVPESPPERLDSPARRPNTPRARKVSGPIRPPRGATR
jgi:excisionase family DNA binding protein